jgi:undecaprenyl-diphosphatase
VLALVAALLRAGRRPWAVLLVVAVPGGMALNVLLKLACARARPQIGPPLVHLLSYSFPSGHANQAMLLYGWAALYVATHAPAARRAAGALALAMVSLVAASRLVLGAHYLTDVLAGMAEGALWLMICSMWCSTAMRHRPPCAAPPSSLTAGRATDTTGTPPPR